jgi:hypothetical protein
MGGNMHASIREIIFYMDNYSKKSCFDRLTGTCRDIKSLEDTIQYSEILIPKIRKYDDIIYSFIQQTNNRYLKSKFTEKKTRNVKDINSYFHTIITDAGLNEKWYDYKENYISILAQKWCEENDIPYTE